MKGAGMNGGTRSSHKRTRFEAKPHESTLLHDEVAALVEKIAPNQNKDLVTQLFNVVVNFASADLDRLDLKIATGALTEMHQAFTTFQPWAGRRKLTIFGSARTPQGHPDYLATVAIAQAMRELGWMIITGAGPGIMAAGIEGAGRDNSFGVNIKLPFEQRPNLFIEQDPKLVEMKYFFTRKLIFTRESQAFLVLPGGFGTMDEAFELLTLMQTGKSQPAPIVLYSSAENSFWKEWEGFMRERLFEGGYVSGEDDSLFLITSEQEAAIAEFDSFYSNFDSLRWVGDLLVLRVRKGPTQEELDLLNQRYGRICASGTIEGIPITGAEKGDRDGLELERVALRFDRSSHGALRRLIDDLNNLSSLPLGESIQLG